VWGAATRAYRAADSPSASTRSALDAHSGRLRLRPLLMREGSTVTSREQKAIRVLFTRLKRAPLRAFPGPRGRLDAPNRHGVYVIYKPSGKVVHVGRTPSGSGGLRQRLGNHLYGASSFTIQYLKGQGSKLRRGYTFRCLVVNSRRRRALLEAYAIGYLCPRHIGLGLPPLSKSK
jgi:hypothetical protein